jgi:membrane fusion protein (multidrug efflux system)
VESIEVQPGQTVQPQQVLVRFFKEAEKEDAAGIKREYELLLGRLLREPNDQSARQGMTKLLAEREQADARLLRRTLRAPRAGRITDVRIRVGQHLEPGEVVVSLAGGERFTLLAMLPGQHRPALHKGQSLRLELSGYKYSYQELVVRSVSSEVVGPTEVRHFLRREIADAVPLSGPVVLVEAELPQATFVADHQVFNFFDGMVGTAEVRVRSERILLALIPELRALVHHVEY